MTSELGDSAFTIEQDRHGDYAVVRLTGEFDLRAAPELRQALLDVIGAETDAAGVLIDMTALEFLDSTIISVLLVANRQAEAANVPLRIAGASERVTRIFDVTGIGGVLATFPSLDAAATVD